MTTSRSSTRFASRIAAATNGRLQIKVYGGGGGVIVPDENRIEALPLEHTEVSADISGFVASVTVEQVFRNHLTEPFERVRQDLNALGCVAVVVCNENSWNRCHGGILYEF